VILNLLGVVRVLAAMGAAVAGYLRDRGLMDAGEAKAALRGFQDAQDAITRAQEIRRLVRDLPGDVRDDLLRKPEDRRPRE